MTHYDDLAFLRHEDLDGDLQAIGGLITMKEAAKAVGVSVETVRHWMKRGQVVTVEWDGRTYLGEQSVYDCELARVRAPQGRPRSDPEGSVGP